MGWIYFLTSGACRESVTIQALPQLKPLPVRPVQQKDKEDMRNWAKDHGKVLRQELFGEKIPSTRHVHFLSAAMTTCKLGGRVVTQQVQDEDAQQEAEDTEEQNISQDEYADGYSESEHESDGSDTESTAENVPVELSFLSQGNVPVVFSATAESVPFVFFWHS